MDQSIVQSLHGLIPAVSGPLPSDLVELARSLLAQSRSAASSLHGEEEIARSYACAHIACERLKQRLSLPRISTNPPCRPKTYQKLHAHLNSVLRTSPEKTSGRARSDTDALNSTTSVKKAKSTASRQAKKEIASRFVTSRSKNLESDDNDQLPPSAMLVIRRLCQKLEAPAAPHHIYVGVASVMKSWNEAKALEDSQESLQFSALSIAIYFFVSSRLAGVEIKSDEWRQKTNIGLSVINELFHEGFEVTQISESDVQLHMRQIAEHRWTDMDWFYNIELGSGVGIPLPDERNSQGGALRVERNERQEFPGRPKASTKNQQPGVEFLQPGLGTMMQRSVDYLSDERLRDYEMWETDIRLRIKEAETVSDAAVDIDAS